MHIYATPEELGAGTEGAGLWSWKCSEKAGTLARDKKLDFLLARNLDPHKKLGLKRIDLE